jgi:hypothetical protein
MTSSIFIAVPSYGNIQSRCVLSILGLFTLPNIKHTICFIDVPLIDVCRSELVHTFLKTDCDYILFIDSDIGFNPKIISDMLETNVNIITAPYRARHGGNNWACKGEYEDLSYEPIHNINGHNVLKLTKAGLGLTLINRIVIEKTIKENPALYYVSDNTNELTSNLFLHEIINERLCYEDEIFYIRTKQAGFQLYGLIDADVDHDGFVDNLGKHILKNKQA